MDDLAGTIQRIKGRWTTGGAAAELAPPAWREVVGEGDEAELNLLALTGREMGAEEALDWGLIDAIEEVEGMRPYTPLEQAGRLIERGVIEVAPLAFMRGRTLNDSFVILDEAQNATREQMKMFLTRLGFNTKAVVTGDVTQIDLPSDQTSGLVDAVRILEHVEGISVMRFTEEDVVRHPLVQSVIRAYDRDDRRTDRG